MQGKSINIFCGSMAGTPEFQALAIQLADRLVAQGSSIVYGGASVGIMGVLADHALRRGGTVIGVMPQHLVSREVAHKGLTELHVVDSMSQRKRKMADLSDGFLALPGGLGTLDEVFEVATEVQLGLYDKPIVLLDSGSYWAPLMQFLDGALKAGLLNARTHAIVRYASSVDKALELLERK